MWFPRETSAPCLELANGVLIAGEAANLLLNAGKAIQGMDYAMRSGILAAETVLEAKTTGVIQWEIGRLPEKTGCQLHYERHLVSGCGACAARSYNAT